MKPVGNDWFSFMTSSLVKIIVESPHSWPKSLFTAAHILFYISYNHTPLIVRETQETNASSYVGLTEPNMERVDTLQLYHNERDDVANHRRLHCLHNCWFRRNSKKTSKLRVTGLSVGNSPVTGEFPARMTSDAENVSIWWRHQYQYTDIPDTTVHVCGRSVTNNRNNAYVYGWN